jgi:hypothetical protein
VLRRLHGYRLPFVILLPPDDLSRDHLHHISAGAADHVRILLNDVHQLALVNGLLVVLREELAALEVLDLLFAPRAFY